MSLHCVQVYERGYIVAERLNSTLETHMTYALVQLLALEPDAPFKKLARPSEYLAGVQTLIDLLQSLETHGTRERTVLYSYASSRAFANFTRNRTSRLYNDSLYCAKCTVLACV